MTQHKVFISPSALDLTTHPTGVLANTAATINGNISGTKSAFRFLITPGEPYIPEQTTYIWDNSLLPASFSRSLAAGERLNFPLTDAHLPSSLFDAIIVPVINGVSYPIGVSTSPDNIGVYTGDQPATDRILFWTDIFAYHSYTNPSPPQGNNYMRGDEAGELSSPLKIYFSEALISNLDVTYRMVYVPSGGTNSVRYVYEGTTSLIAGSDNYVLRTLNIIPEIYNRDGILLPRYPGHFLIKITINDVKFRSLLPTYHWGVD